MPSYRGHIAAGCCVYVGMLLLFYNYISCTSIYWGELFVCTLMGSLFPDIDTKSKGQQIFYAMYFLLLVLLMAYGYIIASLLFSLCCFLPLFCKHRGLFHAPAFLGSMIVGVLIVLLHCFPCHAERIVYNVLFFSLGVASHVFLDRLIKKSSAKKFYRA